MKITEKYLLLEVNLETDLSVLTNHFWAYLIRHRVVITEHSQQVWLKSDTQQDIDHANRCIANWKENTLESVNKNRHKWFTLKELLTTIYKDTPVTLAIIAGLLIVALLTHTEFLSHELFMLNTTLWSEFPFDFKGFFFNSWWKWWSPAFIYNNIFYLALNIFWWWILARPIEKLDGSLRLFSVVITSIFATNFVQYLTSGPVFGGFFGVLTGLMAWIWMRKFELKRDRYHVAPEIFPIMIFFISLFLLLSLIFNLDTTRSMNTASDNTHVHMGMEGMLGGAISGVIMARILAFINSKRRRRASDKKDNS